MRASVWLRDPVRESPLRVSALLWSEGTRSVLPYGRLAIDGESRCWRTRAVRGPSLELGETAADALETPHRLLADPPDHPRGVIAVRQIMVQGREAVRLAAYLHLLELLGFELVIADDAPIIRR